MKLHVAFVVLSLLQAVSTSAQRTDDVPTTTAPTRPPTTVWVTSTLPRGGKTVVASLYTQRYATMYESAEAPLSGAVGLGTQTERVRPAQGGGARAGVGLRVVMVGGMGMGMGMGMVL